MEKLKCNSPPFFFFHNASSSCNIVHRENIREEGALSFPFFVLSFSYKIQIQPSMVHSSDNETALKSRTRIFTRIEEGVHFPPLTMNSFLFGLWLETVLLSDERVHSKSMSYCTMPLCWQGLSWRASKRKKSFFKEKKKAMCEDSSSPHVRKCKAFFSSQYLKSKCLKTLQEFQPLLQLKDDLDEHFFGCYIYCAAGSDQ